jgi:uncharacterized membrane protein
VSVAAAVLIILGVIGLVDATYFVLVSYRAMRPDPRWMPRVCRMDEATCARVVDTPSARILGLPNAVYGVAWYAVAIGAGAAILVKGSLPLCWAYVAVAAATVLLSAYLAWALVVRLHTPCVLCFVGHGVNVGLLAVFGAACLGLGL